MKTKRILAYVIDLNIILTISIALFFSGPRFKMEYLYLPSIHMFSAYGVILGMISIIVLPLFKDCLFKNASLGKWIFGIKVVKQNEGKATLGQLILRNIFFYVPIIDLIFLIVKDRSLGDVISNTVVVLRRTKK